MNVENHIMTVSFCGKFQKAVKEKRSQSFFISSLKEREQVSSGYQCFLFKSRRSHLPQIPMQSDLLFDLPLDMIEPSSFNVFPIMHHRQQNTLYPQRWQTCAENFLRCLDLWLNPTHHKSKTFLLL